jgi:hypothetical protein
MTLFVANSSSTAVLICYFVFLFYSLSQDAVLDLKGVELPVKMMLSSGRDGIIKLWR